MNVQVCECRSDAGSLSFLGFLHWSFIGMKLHQESQTGQTVSAMDPPTSASHLTTQGIKCKPPCLGCSVSSGDRAQGFSLGDKLSNGLQNTLVQFQTQRGFKDSQRGARGQLSSFLLALTLSALFQILLSFFTILFLPSDTSIPASFAMFDCTYMLLQP